LISDFNTSILQTLRTDFDQNCKNLRSLQKFENLQSGFQHWLLLGVTLSNRCYCFLLLFLVPLFRQSNEFFYQFTSNCVLFEPGNAMSFAEALAVASHQAPQPLTLEERHCLVRERERAVGFFSKKKRNGTDSKHI
jgi:hypothetical protein